MTKCTLHLSTLQLDALETRTTSFWQFHCTDKGPSQPYLSSLAFRGLVGLLCSGLLQD